LSAFRSTGTHLSNLVLGGVVLNDGHSVILVGSEPLLDALDVIILTPASLATLKKTAKHDLLGGGKEEDL
jgi:hypothetical protein